MCRQLLAERMRVSPSVSEPVGKWQPEGGQRLTPVALGHAASLTPGPAQQHPGRVRFPPLQHSCPALHTQSPLSALLPSTRCSSPRRDSQMPSYALFLQACPTAHVLGNTQSTIGAPSCHIEQKNKDAERMHVTVFALTENVLVALALGNFPRLPPQLASKRHGWGKRKCSLFLLPCISAFLYQKQRGQLHRVPQTTVLLSYPNTIHCQSCFSWQDKPQSPLPWCTHVYQGGKQQGIQNITTYPKLFEPTNINSPLHFSQAPLCLWHHSFGAGSLFRRWLAPEPRCRPLSMSSLTSRAS